MSNSNGKALGSASVAITFGIHAYPYIFAFVTVGKPTREITRTVLTTSLYTIFRSRAGVKQLRFFVFVETSLGWKSSLNQRRLI